MRAGYYIHIEPGKSFAGGGLYMLQPADLKKVRQEIDYNLDEFRSIIEGKNSGPSMVDYPAIPN